MFPLNWWKAHKRNSAICKVGTSWQEESPYSTSSFLKQESSPIIKEGEKNASVKSTLNEEKEIILLKIDLQNAKQS